MSKENISQEKDHNILKMSKENISQEKDYNILKQKNKVDFIKSIWKHFP